MAKSARELLKGAVQALAGTRSLPDAEDTARAARQALVEAGVAVELAEAGVDEAYAAGGADGVLKAEATLAGARAELDRAKRRLDLAEKRLSEAQAARQAEDRAAGIQRLRAACAQRLEAAQAIDAAFAALGAAVEKLASADAVLYQLQSAGITSQNAVAGHNFGHLRTRILLDSAAYKAGIPGARFPGLPREDVPSTVVAVQRDNATALLGVEQ